MSASNWVMRTSADMLDKMMDNDLALVREYPRGHCPGGFLFGDEGQN